MPRYLVQCDPKTGKGEIRRAHYQADDSLAWVVTADDEAQAFIKTIGPFVDANPNAAPALREAFDKFVEWMEAAITKAKGETTTRQPGG